MSEARNQDEQDNELLQQAIDLLDSAEPSAEAASRLLDSEEGRRALTDVLTAGEAVRANQAPHADVPAAWNRFASRHGIEENVRLADDSHSSSEVEELDHSLDDDETSGQRARRIILYLSAAAAILALLLFPFWRYVQSPSSSPSAPLAHDVSITTDGETKAVSGRELVYKDGDGSELCQLNVPEGRDFKVTLSDGTEVWLNSGSRLSYPSHFNGSDRTVELSGEAYFKVHHDARRPFVVKAGGVTIRDIGTEFNVNCYPDAPAHVTLVEGVVAVVRPEGTVRLAPGDDAVVSNEHLSIRKVDVADVVSWRDGIIPFNDASLREVAVYLCRWYGLNLVSQDEGQLDERLHFVLDRHDSVQAAVDMLRDVSGTEITLSGHNLYIGKRRK